MFYRKIIKFNCSHVLLLCLFLPIITHASYIETTIGTAVVNDATAVYYNPAGLILLKNPQIIPLVNTAKFQTEFSGHSTSIVTHFTESGTARSTTNYYSPSFYLGMPISSRFKIGIAALSNVATRNPDENSILRYTQSNNTIQDFDLVPGVGIKMNDYFAIGTSVNFSHLNLDLHPLSGFPGSNIADSQSHNQSQGNGTGIDIGGLLKVKSSTLIGINYRTMVAYHESGTSKFSGNTTITSNSYHFVLRTPARSTLTISQLITPTIRLVTTLHYTQWSLIQNINVYNVAMLSSNNPAIVDASIPQHLKDTWTFILGSQYQFLPNWVIRIAGTYNESPNNGHYQVNTGDSFILGASVGYNVNKIINIDGSYAHVFMQDQIIDISGKRFLINGINKGERDALSLKLTVNII